MALKSQLWCSGSVVMLRDPGRDADKHARISPIALKIILNPTTAIESDDVTHESIIMDCFSNLRLRKSHFFENAELERLSSDWAKPLVKKISDLSPDTIITRCTDIVWPMTGNRISHDLPESKRTFADFFGGFGSCDTSSPLQLQFLFQSVATIPATPCFLLPARGAGN
jgi:hypothetical protein